MTELKSDDEYARRIARQIRRLQEDECLDYVTAFDAAIPVVRELRSAAIVRGRQQAGDVTTYPGCPKCESTDIVTTTLGVPENDLKCMTCKHTWNERDREGFRSDNKMIESVRPFVRVQGLEFAFIIGEHVKLTVGDDIEGIVTAITLRSNGFRLYEVTWIHAGERKAAWFESFELVNIPQEGKPSSVLGPPKVEHQ